MKAYNTEMDSSDYLDVENSLLSEIVRDNNNFYYVNFLKSEYFLDPINQKIFGAIEYLINSDRIADIVHIVSYLKSDDSFKKSDELISYVKKNIANSSILGTPFNMGNTILNTYLKRNLKTKLLSELENIENVGFFDIRKYIDEFEQDIFELSNVSSKKISTFVSINSSISDVVSNFKKAFHNDEMIHGVSSGFKAIDNIVNGFHKSDLIILAARPSMGKTSLALNIAYNVAKNKSKNSEKNGGVGFFSLEMSSEQIASRIIAMRTDFNTFNIKTARIKDESSGKTKKIDKTSYDNFINIVKEFDNLPIYLNDTPSISVANIASNARRLKNKYDIQLIVIDYLQLIKGDAAYKGNRVQEISSISQALKSLAKELNVPIIALSQLSRGVESRDDKRPLLSDLRESGSIEQDADIVMFVYRENYYKSKEVQENENKPDFVGKIGNEDEAEIIVSKNRNGPVGSNKLRFIKEKTLFEDLDQKKINESFEAIKNEFSNPPTDEENGFVG